MAAKVISMEIGYSLTRICEADYKTKSHKIYKSFTIPTQEGIINDGLLTVSSAYVENLKGALAANHVKSKQVVFSITSSKIASREVVIPYVKENRIADVVNINATDYFPVDLSQYRLAYSILDIIGGHKGPQQYKLLVMAVPAALLSGYYELARALKLEVAAIDYAGNSVFQVVKEECARSTNLIVKIEERDSLVMVVHDSALDFTRNVSYGVEEAIETVMDTLCWGEAASVEQAIHVLQRNDCIAMEETAAVSAKDTAMNEVREAIMPLVSGIARVIDYYTSRNTDSSISRIMITGLGAEFKGLGELLSREISAPVTVLKEAAGWNLGRYFKNECFGEYIACVGAAVEPLGFKKDAEKKGKKSGARGTNGVFAAYSLLAIGLAAGIGLAAFSIMRYMDVQKTNMELRAQESALTDVITIYDAYADTKADYTKVCAMYEATESRNESLYEFLEELEDKLPGSVNVVSLTSDACEVSINMNVDTKEEAAAAIQQMRTFHSLIPEMVTMSSLREDEDRDTGVASINFTVTAYYRPVGYEADKKTADDSLNAVDSGMAK